MTRSISAVGRFLQPDSVVPDYADPQSLNRYSYVLNNPLRYTDPTGQWPEWLENAVECVSNGLDCIRHPITSWGAWGWGRAQWGWGGFRQAADPAAAWVASSTIGLATGIAAATQAAWTSAPRSCGAGTRSNRRWLRRGSGLACRARAVPPPPPVRRRGPNRYRSALVNQR